VTLTKEVCLIACAIAAAGCDGGEDTPERLTKREYQRAILEIVEDSTKANALYLGVVVRPLPRERCADGVRALHDEVRGLIDRVASLRPPREVTGVQEEFMAAANKSLDRVRAVGSRVAAGEVSCGQELNNLIYGLPSSDRAERAIGELERRGYYVRGD
jgi:hypothetical protein